MILQLILGIWIILILALSFKDLKTGLALYLPYIFLVPYMQIHFVGLNLSWNLVNTAILISFYLWKQKKHAKIDWRPLLPFIGLYVYYFLVMPLKAEVPYGLQFNIWRASFMSTLIVPFVLWNVICKESSSVKLFRNVTIVSIFMATFYGLILTRFNGLNPYLLALSQISGVEYNEDYAMVGNGRMFGRIFSCFGHPMTFGLFLGLSFIYLYHNRKDLNYVVFWILFVMLSVDIVVCGVRSVIAGLIVAIAYFFLAGRQYRAMMQAAVACFIGYLIIMQIPELADYVGSVFDIQNKKQAVGGSSVEMRIDQLNGCLKEIQSDPLLGRGYNWHGYYQQIRGDHPVILAFESLIYVVLCDFGFVGIIVWVIFLIRVFVRTIKIMNQKKNDYILPTVLMVFYVAYSCVTGEYGYMKYLLIFYVLMLGETMQKKKYIGVKR